jgi:hypothetical protein
LVAWRRVAVPAREPADIAADFLDASHMPFVIETADTVRVGLFWVEGTDWQHRPALEGFPIVGYQLRRR